MADRIETVLAECLERLRQGESVEQCLARYPERAAELEPLLRVAIASRGASGAVAPRPEFKARARLEIRARLAGSEREARPRKASPVGWIPRWAVVVASLVLIFLMAGTGTAAASTGSMPDDTLYPVKLAMERVRVRLTPGDIKKARINVHLADIRVKEIVYLAKKGDSRRLERALSRLEGHVEVVERVIEANEHRPKVQKALSVLKSVLEERIAENTAAIEAATNNTDDPGLLQRILEWYRQGHRVAAAVGWRGST